MTYLYSCKHEGDLYRVTKFDEHLNVESSYLTDGQACDCPAGQRPKCRHREMLPYFINRNAVGKGEMFDFDRGGWVRVFEDPQSDPLLDSRNPNHGCSGELRNDPAEVPGPVTSVEAAEGVDEQESLVPVEGSNLLPSAARGFKSRF